MTVGEWVSGWNQYFQIQGTFARDMPEPWKSYSLNRLTGMLRSLVDFLSGDRDAIDRFEEYSLKAIEQIRQSQHLLKEALGEEEFNRLDNSPLCREHPEEQGLMKGLTYVSLTGIPDTQEARSFLESLIGSPVESCSGCGRLFVRSGKNRKLCEGCKGTGQDEEAPRRKAYRQVFMAFKRRLDKGLSKESARQSLLDEQKYADLIRQWNFDLSDWN